MLASCRVCQQQQQGLSCCDIWHQLLLQPTACPHAVMSVTQICCTMFNHLLMPPSPPAPTLTHPPPTHTHHTPTSHHRQLAELQADLAGLRQRILSSANIEDVEQPGAPASGEGKAVPELAVAVGGRLLQPLCRVDCRAARRLGV